MDYSKIVHPVVGSPVAVYKSDQDLDKRVLVKFSNGLWGIYYPNGTISNLDKWGRDLNGAEIFTEPTMHSIGWKNYMEAKPIWTAESKALSKSNNCKCDMITLMLKGCPSAKKGGICPSI